MAHALLMLCCANHTSSLSDTGAELFRPGCHLNRKISPYTGLQDPACLGA